MSDLEDKFKNELKVQYDKMTEEIAPLLNHASQLLKEATNISKKYGFGFYSHISPINQQYNVNIYELSKKYSHYLSKIVDKNSESYNEEYDDESDAMRQIYEAITGMYVGDYDMCYDGWTHSAVC